MQVKHKTYKNIMVAAAALVVGLILVVGWFLRSIILVSIGGGITLPDPTGMYDVGRTSIYWLDEDRAEQFTADNPADNRAVAALVYYPAQVNHMQVVPAPYMHPDHLETIAQANGVPAFLLRLIHSNSYADAQIVEQGEFPVLLFSPGINTQTEIYAALLEDVASHGYIIFALYHPYDTPAVILDNGDVLLEEHNNYVWEEDDSARTVSGSVWRDDMLFVLNRLEEINNTHPLLANTLDLNKIGAFGHSFGGGTAVWAAESDDRIIASLNMDGSMQTALESTGVTHPFVLVNAGEIPDERMTMVTQHSPQGTLINIEGFEHDTFTTDLVFLRPLLPFIITEDLVGNLPAERVNNIVAQVVLAHFDTHLKGETLNRVFDDTVTIVHP